MSRIIEIKEGQRFGRLTVIREEPPIIVNGKSFRNVRFRCDCGKEFCMKPYDVIHGRTSSCGCYKSDLVSTHRLTNTRIYTIWRAMRRRCTPKAEQRMLKHYYGKGIRVCEEWNNDFEAFYKWAIENGYKDDLTIDRIDGSKDYSPDNCRWTTMAVQLRNRCNSHYIEINGQSKTITDWCEFYNINIGTVNKRLHKGMDALTALTTPPDPKYRTRGRTKKTI